MQQPEDQYFLDNAASHRNMMFFSAGPLRGGQEGPFALGSKGLTSLIIEDFRMIF